MKKEFVSRKLGRVWAIPITEQTVWDFVDRKPGPHPAASMGATTNPAARRIDSFNLYIAVDEMYNEVYGYHTHKIGIGDYIIVDEKNRVVNTMSGEAFEKAYKPVEPAPPRERMEKEVVTMLGSLCRIEWEATELYKEVKVWPQDLQEMLWLGFQRGFQSGFISATKSAVEFDRPNGGEG